jgi:hypothetical protein
MVIPSWGEIHVLPTPGAGMKIGVNVGVDAFVEEGV